MRRRTARPYGQSTSYARLVSMVMALLVLGLFYNRLKDPAIWRFITDDNLQAQEAESPRQAAPEEPEIIVPGPNDLDQASAEEMRRLLDFVVDRAPLKSREMHAYWKFIDWSRTQPLQELERRAMKNVPFRELWEQPDDYRGKLIRLRLHVRLIVKYEPNNQSDTQTVYEAWGWTDDSLSFPYVIVFPDAPEGMPLGRDIRAEMVFTGYFLKIMTYTAFDHPRGAPLLVGRARMAHKDDQLAPVESSSTMPYLPIIGIGSILAVAAAIFVSRRYKRTLQRAPLPEALSSGSSFALTDSEEAASSNGGINFDFLNEHRESSSNDDHTR